MVQLVSLKTMVQLTLPLLVQMAMRLQLHRALIWCKLKLNSGAFFIEQFLIRYVFRFGSNIVGQKTGIIYNNQMDDFACPSSECNSYSLPNYAINYIQPGKRPVSSMTPLIAINPDNSVRLVSGGSGGTRIITSTALTTAKNILLDHDLLDSIDSPRVHQQLWPDEVLYEDSFDRVSSSFLFILLI